MTKPTLAEFRARFPEFDQSRTDPVVEDLLNEAYETHSRSPRATLFCAAHLATLEGEATGEVDGGAGVVAGESIGPRRVEYRTQASGDGNERAAFFATSSYGRRFLNLEARSSAVVGARVVG